MNAVVAVLLVLVGSAPCAGAMDTIDGGRFRTVAVLVDTESAPLAAYQIEITVDVSEPTAKIVGVEGGEPAAFRAAPYYDPAALQGGRIVIAAFSTDAALPRGRIRVATLHLFEPAGSTPAYRARLVVAVEGATLRDVDATVTLEPDGGDA